jgi:prophage endopeptidase
MDRTELIVVTATVLFAAFCIGWGACWAWHRLTRVTGADVSELDRMASALHEAEEARDLAVAHQEQREAELTARLNQSEAELAAAMDGLRAARTEAADLRAWIEQQAQG